MPSSPNVAHVRRLGQPSRRLLWDTNPQLLGRLAWSGLAVVLLFLACFSIFIAVSTHLAADNVRRSASERNAYEAARYDVAAEESLERKYRLQPSPEVRELHAAAARSLVLHLTFASRYADEGQEMELIPSILATHSRYLGTAAHMFDVVDLGDTEQVNQIDVQEVDPLFGSIDELVNQTADALNEEANTDFTALSDLENVVLWTTPVVFVIGFVLLGLFWLVLNSFQRRIDQTAMRFRSLVQNASDVGTTGEGIETDGQQEQLRTLGCDAGQGFLFARPAPAPVIEALLARNAELPRAA